jgi:hypothetical protein
MEINNIMKKLSEKIDQVCAPKLCKNCKWARKDWELFFLSFGTNGWKYAKCGNPLILNVKSDLVSGIGSSPFCSVERGEWGPLTSCGPEGKFYEPKK